MSDNVDKKVFSFVNNKPDYTGAKAKEYIDKYTNRPEDAGTIEGLQSILGAIGLVAEPADWINASIYASKGDKMNAAIHGSGLGIAGSLKIGGKLFQKIQKAFGINKAEKAFDHIRSLGFRNFSDFEDWIILKSESDEVFRKEIGPEQVNYFSWLKKRKEELKLDKLKPRNIEIKDVLKSDDPLTTFKEAVKAGNPQVKSMLPNPKNYGKLTQESADIKAFEAMKAGTKIKKY